ncbi:MAG: protein kinase [Pseudonocardia sp.]|uniref:protein kinase domain-containing protein n=1 Tax=Pseudonocardia sp. TaxID=60912 RepID=UPI001AC73E62|nr:protein kinase [Pseudonocardia sp.]MBN9102324.1 protein kinase [Pseudonocardia sp.]
MQLPDAVGTWIVQARLGSGDFGAVYRVKSNDVEGALKMPNATSPAATARLDFERIALEALQHKGVPALIADGLHNDTPFIVMSIAPGISIQHHVERNAQLGRLFGDIETLGILTSLLETVEHVHARRLVHRDIKGANVLYDARLSQVTLLDFGFCKEAGRSDTRSEDSFWRVGSSRFSPPSKLSNPAYADPAHDVFAVGVLGYLMLTGRYPWSAAKSDDVAALRRAQLGQPLEPITETNSFVLTEVSHWISSLLELDDLKRPSAADALKQARAIQQHLIDSADSPVRRIQTLRFPQVIRDPIHGDIRLTEYEYRVLLTREIQRLRSIRQLGLTNMVYPGAEHSRLSHSIGCVARVEQILSNIEARDGIRIDPDLRQSARLFALTHDVTHIPFGHTLEDELGMFDRHDSNTARRRRLVDNRSSELGAKLRETDIGRMILPYLASSSTSNPTPLFVEIVSGDTGADVLDYIDRDAYFCGLDHRVDSAIFRQFRLHALVQSTDRRLVSVVGGKYGIRLDRSFAIETVLKERYAMFLKVYTHSAKAAASALLGKALFSQRSSRTESRTVLTEAVIEGLGDDVLIDRLGSSSDRTTSWLAKKLRYRDLPRGIYRGVMLERSVRNEEDYKDRRAWLQRSGMTEPAGRADLEARLALSAGLDARQVIVYCPPKAPGFQQVEHWVTRTQDESNPTLQGHSLSAEIARRHLELWELWVFVVDAQDDRARIRLAEAAQDLFGMPNLIETDRLQGRLI